MYKRPLGVEVQKVKADVVRGDGLGSIIVIVQTSWIIERVMRGGKYIPWPCLPWNGGISRCQLQSFSL